MNPPKTLTCKPAPTGARTVPATIDREEFAEALAPLLALLGLSAHGIMRHGLTITGDSIELLTVEPLADVDAQPSVGDDAEYGVWTWPVSVEVAP